MIAVEQRLRHWAAAFPVLEPARAAWVPQQLVPLAELTERDLAEARATHRAIEMLARPLRETLLRTYVLGMPAYRQALLHGLHAEIVERWLQQAHSAVHMATRGLVSYRVAADPWEMTP